MNMKMKIKMYVIPHEKLSIYCGKILIQLFNTNLSLGCSLLEH